MEPKSITQVSDGRRTMSIALIHGRKTSAFGRPFAFPPVANQTRATLPSISNGPYFLMPSKHIPEFSVKTDTLVKSDD
jgi:hypothetical protein